jgi:signal transduction histidine kinase
MTSPTTADPERPLEPLWRGLLVYRVLALVSAGVVVIAALPEYRSPGGAVAVLVVMAGWTAFLGYGYLVAGARSGRRGVIAIADVAVTVAVMASTPLVQTAAQLAADAPVMGSIWTPGAVLACALCFGVPGGLAGAVVVSATLLAAQARPQTELGDILLIVLVGLTVGFAATVLRRQAERVRRAVAAEAAAVERERLAREVHDGVLQVLGYLRRRGGELGGDAGELGRLAGEQEFVLRALLTSGPAAVDAAGRRDLAAALRTLGSARISVATPAHAVELPAAAVDELVAVVGAALANVSVHVGPDAPAWVLLEDLGAEVEISVRDDGPGIPAGRLAAAAADGRIGVARSMRGRVHDLGGTITCDTGPGSGTEWIIRVPREVVA